MKNKIYLSIILAVFIAVLFAACKKEGTVTLVAQFEKAQGSKAYINDHYACWSNGDAVQINGVQYTISVTHPTSGTEYAVIDSVTKSNTGYYALYPASYGINFTDGANITLPAELTYQETSPGVQRLTAPMVAKADGDNVLKFYNLCTLLEVHVPASNAILKAIKVESSSKKLAGTTSVTFDGGTPTLSNITNPVVSSTSVTMNFGADGVSVQSGKTVYIPVPPVANNESLTIYVMNKGGEYKDSTLVSTTVIPANNIVRIDAPMVPQLSDYELHSYIWSRSSGYINLGVKPQVGSKLELVYMLGSKGVKTSQYICGSRGGGGQNNNFAWFAIAGKQSHPDSGFSCNVCGVQVRNSTTQGGWRRMANKKYSVVAEILSGSDETGDYVYGIVEFNNITDGLSRVDTTAKYYGTISSTVNDILLFALTPDQIHRSLKIYSFRYYVGNNVIHDFLPCVCTDGGAYDGQVGMYDNRGSNGFVLPVPRTGTSVTPFAVGDD